MACGEIGGHILLAGCEKGMEYGSDVLGDHLPGRLVGSAVGGAVALPIAATVAAVGSVGVGALGVVGHAALAGKQVKAKVKGKGKKGAAPILMKARAELGEEIIPVALGS